MDNSEVDLFQVANNIWKKKKQILFYTLLIVVCAVLFSYVQPKYYETQMSAFILPPNAKFSPSTKTLPQEYYERFSKSPKILDAILKNLPKEVRLDGNDTPINNLNSMLRVQSKVIPSRAGLTSSVLKLNYSVRSPDPDYAHQVANTWQNVLEESIGQFEKEMILRRYSEVKEKLSLIKTKWDAAKKWLADFRENYNIQNKKMEVESIRRLILKARLGSENLINKMDLANTLKAKSEKINDYKVEKIWIEEQYLSAKDTLNEFKRLLGIHPQFISSPSSANEQGSNETLLNPVYLKLQEEVLLHEVQLKTFVFQKVRLEKLIRELESDVNNPTQVEASSNFSHEKQQLKMLAEKIKRYEEEVSELEKQIHIKIYEEGTLIKAEKVLAIVFKDKFRINEEWELVKAFDPPMRLDFSISTLEPTVLLGFPILKIALIAFGSGLIFMILVTLMKASFTVQSKD